MMPSMFLFKGILKWNFEPVWGEAVETVELPLPLHFG